MSVPGGAFALDETRLLLELSREITGTLDVQGVLDKSVAALRRIVRFGGGSIQLIHDGELALAAGDPPPTPEALAMRIPLGRGIGGEIAATGEPIYIPDIAADPRVPPDGRRALSPGVRSYFGLPLILHGEPIGVIQVDSPLADGFPVEARALVLAFAPTIAAAVQNAQLFERELATVEGLRSAERLRSDFLAMVSHELRTPLTSLTGFAELLAARGDRLPPELVAEFGRRMWRAGRWLSRMIEDLLDLSRIERGTLTVETADVDVASVLEEVAGSFHDAHPIIVAAEPGLPRALADPARLHQILGNLVSNAKKFSPPGSRITLAAQREDGRVAVAVADCGRGIPQEALALIFEPFVQIEAATTREAGGLGTGLYLVKELCDRMGAEIRVDSEPGVGSVFTILLRPAGGAAVR